LKTTARGARLIGWTLIPGPAGKTPVSSKQSPCCPNKYELPRLIEELYSIEFKLDIELNEVVNLSVN